MGQRDQGLDENTLRWGKSIRGTETPIFGELISLKNSKIPQRNQGITNGGLGVTLTVVLVCVRERELRKTVKGYVLSRGFKPVKTG
jgi:hypothetical protein